MLDQIRLIYDQWWSNIVNRLSPKLQARLIIPFPTALWTRWHRDRIKREIIFNKIKAHTSFLHLNYKPLIFSKFNLFILSILVHLVDDVFVSKSGIMCVFGAYFIFSNLNTVTITVKLSQTVFLLFIIIYNGKEIKTFWSLSVHILSISYQLCCVDWDPKLLTSSYEYSLYSYQVGGSQLSTGWKADHWLFRSMYLMYHPNQY